MTPSELSLLVFQLEVARLCVVTQFGSAIEVAHALVEDGAITKGHRNERCNQNRDEFDPPSQADDRVLPSAGRGVVRESILKEGARSLLGASAASQPAEGCPCAMGLARLPVKYAPV